MRWDSERNVQSNYKIVVNVSIKLSCQHTNHHQLIPGTVLLEKLMFYTPLCYDGTITYYYMAQSIRLMVYASHCTDGMCCRMFVIADVAHSLKSDKRICCLCTRIIAKNTFQVTNFFVDPGFLYIFTQKLFSNLFQQIFQYFKVDKNVQYCSEHQN